ncbi:hypothetical protein SRHO_G00311440 [Serrasalmus rhombeus]
MSAISRPRHRGAAAAAALPVPPPESSSAPFPAPASLLKHIRYENLAAGLSGGVIATMVLHPLDLVKIRFADACKLETAGRSDLLPLRSCGLGGWSPSESTWPSSGSGCYNAIKAYTQEGRQDELSALEHLVSAAEAGILTLCLTNPVWVTKTRLVLQYNAEPDGKQYKGMLDALVKIYRHEGIPGLYRGFLPGLVGTTQAALQFMTYEGLKREQNRYKEMPSEALLSPLEYIVMAAVSKIVAVAATYPYQVVRARLQDQHNNYSGIADVIRRTWRNEGVEGFYKGMVPNLVRVIPACCITFLVYENVSRLLLGQYH